MVRRILFGPFGVLADLWGARYPGAREWWWRFCDLRFWRTGKVAWLTRGHPALRTPNVMWHHDQILRNPGGEE